MKYNKSIMAAIAAVAILSTVPAGAAESKTYSWAPYVGVDYQRMSFNYNNNYDVGGGLALDGETVLDDSLNGLNLHIGARPYENLGFELGYFRTENADKDITAGETVGPGTVALTNFTTHTRVQGVTLDAMGYLPVTQQVELIGTAGLLWNQAKAEFAGYGNEKKSEIDWRIGAGAQVNVVNNVNLRGLVRYQTADFKDVADNAWVYTIGVNYGF